MKPTTFMLKDYINWRYVLSPKCARYAGGHEDIMNNLFKKSKVLASYIENDYQGEELFLYQIKINEKYYFVLVSDFFGSCSGCDSYDGCTDETLKNLCIELANNADVFENILSVVSILKESLTNPIYYKYRGTAEKMLVELKKLRKFKIELILS